MDDDVTRIEICRRCPHRGELRAFHEVPYIGAKAPVQVEVTHVAACFLESALLRRESSLEPLLITELSYHIPHGCPFKLEHEMIVHNRGVY